MVARHRRWWGGELTQEEGRGPEIPRRGYASVRAVVSSVANRRKLCRGPKERFRTLVDVAMIQLVWYVAGESTNRQCWAVR